MTMSKNKINLMITIRISEKNWKKMEWILERNSVPIRFCLKSHQTNGEKMKGLFGVVLSFLLSYSKNDVVKELEVINEIKRIKYEYWRFSLF